MTLFEDSWKARLDELKEDAAQAVKELEEQHEEQLEKLEDGLNEKSGLGARKYSSKYLNLKKIQERVVK